ncbi:uncharacterized protein [Antedon mediterranea]|uniref:uncharacterized protein n=1 Tax=Antedon mediterranea TaxID=105859 RepID=UPI003AF9EC4B
MASQLETLNISLAIMEFVTQWQMQQRQIDARLLLLRRRRRRVACQLKTMIEKMYPPPPTDEEVEEAETSSPQESSKRKYKKRATKKKQVTPESIDGINPKPRAWTLTKENHWFENDVPQFTDLEFLEHFHVSRKTFKLICDHLQSDLTKAHTNMRQAISVEKRVAVSLYMLGKSKACTYRNIADLFSMGKSTIGGTLYDFTKAVCKRLLPLIRFPSEESMSDIGKGFNSAVGFPDCIGALNFIHIPLFTPLGSSLPTDYLNENGWYSMILMCVTDHQNRFTYVKSGFPGKLDNLGIFKESSLNQLATDGKIVPESQDVHLVADVDMPLQNWLLTPFVDDGSLNEVQRLYNKRLHSVLDFSQTAMEKLKGRWGFLLNKCNKKLDRAANIFITCCILHNICEEHGDGFLDSWMNEVRLADAAAPQQPIGVPFADDCSTDALVKRNEVAYNLQTLGIVDMNIEMEMNQP